MATLIKKYISIPCLINYTSHVSIVDCIKNPRSALRRMRIRKQILSEHMLKNIKIEQELAERLAVICNANKLASSQGITYGNILMYGPEGTGKLSCAKRLAIHSGMNYALIKGRDLLQLIKTERTNSKKEIVTTFAWASRKKVILVVEDADIFINNELCKYEKYHLQFIESAIIKEVIDREVMMILLCKDQQIFQANIFKETIGCVLQFELPSNSSRADIFKCQLQNILIGRTPDGTKLKLDDFNHNDFCKEMADITKQMSGEDIYNIGQMWQTTAYLSSNGVLTKQMANKVCMEAIEQFKKEVQWQTEQELKKFKLCSSGTS